MQLVAVFPVFAGYANADMANDAVTLRPQLLAQRIKRVALFFELLFGETFRVGPVAIIVRSVNGVNCWQHGSRGCPVDSRKSGRRYQQRQGDDEMFHENSLEAISGNVKRAA
jgi:hypothetical protein